MTDPQQQENNLSPVGPILAEGIELSKNLAYDNTITPTKKINYLPYAIVIAVLVGYLGVKPLVDYVLPNQMTTKETELAKENAKLKAEAKALKDKEEADQALGQYVINMIAKTRNKTKFSDAKKQVIARAVVRVADEIFNTIDHQHAFVAVLAIESEFERTARSTGTIAGIGQTARSSFHEGLEGCGLPKADDSDITELDLGLYASACYYKGLLIANNNDTYMALVAYNQGLYSKSAKTYSANGTLDNTEALKYISRFTYLTRSVTDKKSPSPQPKTKPEGK